jgi:hypothetical protein
VFASPTTATAVVRTATATTDDQHIDRPTGHAGQRARAGERVDPIAPYIRLGAAGK